MGSSATKTIGSIIADLRKSRGETQQQMAERIGVSTQSVSKGETDASLPDLAMLPAIAFEGAAASVPEYGLVPIAMGMIMQMSNIGVFFGPIGFAAAIQAQGWQGGVGPLLASISVLLVAAMMLRERSQNELKAPSKGSFM